MWYKIVEGGLGQGKVDSLYVSHGTDQAKKVIQIERFVIQKRDSIEVFMKGKERQVEPNTY